MGPDVCGQLGLESLHTHEDELHCFPSLLNSFLPNDAGFFIHKYSKALDEIIYSCWIVEQLKLLTFL